MHFCGIIIKHKNISVVEAREALGDILVEKGVADWFSTGDYRERTFDGEVVISLEHFKDVFFNEWLTSLAPDEDRNRHTFKECWPFAVIDDEGYVSESIIPSGFYEFYEYKEDRTELVNMYARVYTKATVDIINRLLESDEEYDVVLLDYHC